MTLETRRLILRPMTEDDTDALLHVFGDPKVMDCFQSPPFDRDQMAGWVARNLEHQNRYGYGLFSVVERGSGLLLGDCGLERMDVDGTPVCELGYDLRSDVWNRGFATEAACAVRDYAFDALNLPELVSLIRVGNEPSRRVAEKVGMHLAETWDNHGVPYWKMRLTRLDQALRERQSP